MPKLNALVAGSTGYIGVQLIKILVKHKYINIKYLCGNSSVGKKISNFEKTLSNKKLPKISFAKNTTYMCDLRWIEATLHIAKNCKKKNLIQVVDLDNYKLNAQIKQIVDLSSFPIFSETGAFEYTKIKSIIGSLKKMYSKKRKFYAITAGEKGVYWIENGNIVNCKPPKIKVVETNCAVDVFHGAFAAFIHQKHSVMDTMKLATATASLKCTKKGGIYSIPSYSSVKKFENKIQLRKI